MPSYIHIIMKGYRMKSKIITALFTIIAMTSPLMAMKEDDQSDQKGKDANYCLIDWDTHDKLTALTVYKRDLYLQRLVEKGIVTLDHIKEIHDEIDNGLTYHPDLLSKQHLNPEREECALRIAKDRTLELINILRDPEEKKAFLNIHKRDAFAIILVTGQIGSGKSRMACALARAAGMSQMFVPAVTLIDETSRGTMLRLRDLMDNFCKKKNTALILTDADCLFNNVKNKAVSSDSCMSILRQSLHKSDKKTSGNLFICTLENPSPLYQNVCEISSSHIHMEHPDAQQRFEIIKTMLAGHVRIVDETLHELASLSERLVDCTPKDLQGIVNDLVLEASIDQRRIDGDRTNPLPLLTKEHIQEKWINFALEKIGGPAERLAYLKHLFSFHAQLDNSALLKLNDAVTQTMHLSTNDIFMIANNTIQKARYRAWEKRKMEKTQQVDQGDTLIITAQDLENVLKNERFGL